MASLQLYFALLLTFLATEVPPLTARVVDLAGLLSTGERRSLDERLAREEELSSVQIAVCIIPTVDGEPLEDYSLRLAETWRIGQEGLDNGAIILVVQDERRVRIEVGYGLEPVVPDGVAGRIIRERIMPRFQEGDFIEGLNAAVDALIQASRNEFPPGEQAGSSEAAPSRGPQIVGGFIFAAFGWLIASAILRAIMLPPWLATGVSGALALPLFAFLCGWLTWITVFILAPLGFALGALLGRRIYRSSSRTGKSTSRSSRRRSSHEVSTSSTSHGSRGDSFTGSGGEFGGGGASGRW